VARRAGCSVSARAPNRAKASAPGKIHVVAAGGETIFMRPCINISSVIPPTKTAGHENDLCDSPHKNNRGGKTMTGAPVATGKRELLHDELTVAEIPQVRRS
jgi:hypothetical protein